ncbi:unnamed protein product [Caenorhabditis angaria]|uniref:Uncharacterized protein n=1 Tax=Caenorhabditis angaria TaxID=860376 RepID=A0A9P1J6U9_9PELO|nr:unnamed protein product [Caenorhabditis angaria]
MCFLNLCKKLRPNPLVFIFCVSSCCFTFGLCIAIYDINNYGSGLYLALVSIVTVVVVLAFCLVGTDEQEPSSRNRAGLKAQHLPMNRIQHYDIIKNSSSKYKKSLIAQCTYKV